MTYLIFPILIGLLLWACHISAGREGRDSKGKFIREHKEVKRPLFYSELRGGVIV